MIINRFVPFKGQHCETTAMGNLLSNIGIRLSEPILFGIGEGLGFIYWESKGMDFPFIGGRAKPDLITKRIASRLNLTLNIQETSSKAKAWNNIKDNLDKGIPIGLKLDCYHLDYFTTKIHFAAHYVAMYGYDDQYAYLIDTCQQGEKVKTRLETLALARSEKGSMSSKNLSYTIQKSGDAPQLAVIIREAISRNAYEFLNPPIRNLGIKGIEKMSSEILKWPSRKPDISHELSLTASLMERAGTGGSLFRNLYRDFLKECVDLYKDSRIEKAYLIYERVALLWKEVSDLLDKASENESGNLFVQASGLLHQIAQQEKQAMELLIRLDKK
ncbi:BtrH N-terminal domain-containing protein [Paenibacillus harenae]|uniref:BtrH N-terminal domain-containing protein n=1 Tax=Paenibacillus harenae TaxID=306543 RepID=UPI00278E6937|nr:BtrH N-terminal domain-containing protein [Paenibacillus harenae]MDQ0058791.1 hypothetical protein [Paenibacillus harenae]